MALFLLIGCNGGQTGESTGLGLAVYETETGIGQVDAANNEQRLRYTFNLTNESERPIYVQGVTPVLTSPFNDLVLNDATRQAVDATIAPGETLPVQGEILFAAEGRSKAEIEALAPYFSSVRVTTEYELPLP
jgi:hypothetical protein